MRQRHLLLGAAAIMVMLVAGTAFVLRHTPKEKSSPAVPTTKAVTLSSGSAGSTDSKAVSKPATQAQTNSETLGALSPTSRNQLSAIAGKRYSIENLGDEFASLSDKAKNGDMVAARTLVNALRVCASIPATWDDMDSAIADANRTDLSPNWKTIKLHNLENQKNLFPQCSGTTKEGFATRRTWLGMLAESGDPDARLQYVSAARPDDYVAADYDKQLAAYIDNADRYIHAEIDAGNPKGLLTMGQQYFASGASIVGVAPPLYANNASQAYAYFYAYSLAAPNDSAIIEGSPDNITTLMLKNLQGQLTPEQIQSATNAGTELYVNCCNHKH